MTPNNSRSSLIYGMAFCLAAFFLDYASTVLGNLMLQVGTESNLLLDMTSISTFTYTYAQMRGIQLALGLLPLTLFLLRGFQSFAVSSLPWWVWGGYTMYIVIGNVHLVAFFWFVPR